MAAKNPNRAAAVLPIPEWEQWMVDHPDITVVLPDGTEISVPPPERWSDDAMEFVEEHPDRPIGLAKLILTDTQRTQIADAGANTAYVLDQIGVAAGIEPGKSSALSGS